MSPALRPARADDLPALLSIWRRAVERTHDFLQPDDLVAIASHVETAYLPSARLTVAEMPGARLAGFVGGPPGEIEALFVDPAFHRRGVGRALAHHAMAEADEVRLDVNEQNPGAVAFYSSLGFDSVGRSGFDGQGHPYPLVHMLWRRSRDS
jgi:putative acetyltransferase